MSGRGRRRISRRPRKIARVESKVTHVANNPRLQFARSGAFVPSRMRVSLRFAVNFAVAASTSSATSFVSGNNMLDPGLSLSTNKCVGFSFLASLYGRYRVYGSKLSIRTVMSTSSVATSQTMSGAVVIYPTNTGASTTLFADAMSQPFAKWQDITSATPKSLTCVMQTSKLSGQKDMTGSDRQQALVSAAPADEWYWAIVYAADAAYTNGSVVIDAQVTYDVEFFDRLEINRSIEALHDKAYELRCIELNDKKRKPAQAELLRQHSEDIARELKEIDAYQKLHKTFEPTDFKDSVRGPLILDNTTVHEKWLKLREVEDQLPKETPKSRPPSRK